ncbi:tigger transposable element-derived protein 6-like [Mercenaria mercenaria]|uniref:tigger transposable element-derived protein 6-like n=1 Tax=Mercenaria mercenaria TaxID=6596 RepID=UPI00234F5AFB|nr:tigger transposable element-derived protein 6-like [Mercenaria mercenaria]
MDETSLFYKQGKSTTFCVAGSDLAGGKRAKDRITVALCASMTGEKLKPLVIGKSRKPRCFSRINVDSLSVTYRFNKKSWMNSGLFEEWLSSVDKQMKRQKRNILLFLDNAPSHPNIQLSNVKVVFLSSNTTSVAQPMDQGIIQTKKPKFYQQQSQHIINEMEKSTQSGSELLKQISVLDTIFWINRAWKTVDATTTMKCFDKCGFEKVRQTPIETESHSDCDSDDDIPLIELARSQGIYGTDIREISMMIFRPVTTVK